MIYVRILSWFLRRPKACAIVSAISLLDAANCVRLGHEDWWVPASLAAAAALAVRRPRSA